MCNLCMLNTGSRTQKKFSLIKLSLGDSAGETNVTENTQWVYPTSIGAIFSTTALLYYEDEPRIKHNTYQESTFLNVNAKKKSYRMATGIQRGKRCPGYKAIQDDSFTIL